MLTRAALEAQLIVRMHWPNDLPLLQRALDELQADRRVSCVGATIQLLEMPRDLLRRPNGQDRARDLKPDPRAADGALSVFDLIDRLLNGSDDG